MKKKLILILCVIVTLFTLTACVRDLTPAEELLSAGIASSAQPAGEIQDAPATFSVTAVK